MGDEILSSDDESEYLHSIFEKDPDEHEGSNIEYVFIDEMSVEIIHSISENKLIEEDVYQCSTCEQSFTDVMSHIKQYHKNQSVLIESGESENSLVHKLNLDEIDGNIIEERVDEEDMQYLSNNKKDIEIDESSDTIMFEDISEVYIDELKQFDEEIRDIKEYKEVEQNLTVKEKMLDAFSKSKTCPICQTTFPSVKNLKLHGRMHNPVKSKSYDEAFGSLNRSTNLFQCELCQKSFDIKLKDQHSKFHRECNENTTCNICNKQFKSEKTLRLHMTLHEQNINTSVGSFLKKKTKAEKAGIIHPYACQHCGRTFKRPHEKVKHERIHTGEKPFKCDVCGKSFRVSYSLNLHLRTHTGIRPYVCVICNKRFKGYSTYAHHLLIHSEERNFKCSECPKSFKTAVQLHGHKKTHTKPFFCSECNRPFATMYAVEVHMETHKKNINKKKIKYFCDICGATYGRSFALEEHKKEVHNASDIIIKNLDYFCNEGNVLPTECTLPTDELFKE